MVVEGYVAIDIFRDHVATASIPARLPRVAAAQPVAPPVPPAPAASETELPPPQPMGAAPPQPALPNFAENVAPSAAPPAPPKQAEVPKVLTTEILEKAVRSTTEPKILFKTPENYNVRPYSAWLELPEELAATIKRVEYSFLAPGFVNPKKSLPNSNIFITKWKGFGCVTQAQVVAYLKNGKKVYGSFDLCKVQERT
jgi:hypothetical protein